MDLRDLNRDKDQVAPYSAMFMVLVLYLSVEYIRPQEFLPGLAMLRPGLILGSVLILFSISHFRQGAFNDVITRYMLGFVLLVGLSVLMAVNQRYVFNTFKAMFLYLFAVIIPMIIMVNSKSRLQLLIHSWIAVHVGLAVYAITNSGRGTGSFLSDENDLALALNTAIPFAYFMGSQAVKASRKLLMMSALLIMVIGVVVTMSRGGFVGLAVTMLAVIWFSKNKIKNAFSVALLGVVFLLAVPATYMEEISSISDTQDNTRSERLFLWGRAWEMYVDNPLFGVGAGNYTHRVAEYQLKSTSVSGYERVLWGKAVHSMPFQLISEMGSTGLICVLLILRGTMRRLREVFNKTEQLPESSELKFFEASARSIATAGVGFLATSIFISVLYYPQMWYLVAFAVLTSAVMRESVRNI